jgi:hypothetical protein
MASRASLERPSIVAMSTDAYYPTKPDLACAPKHHFVPFCSDHPCITKSPPSYLYTFSLFLSILFLKSCPEQAHWRLVAPSWGYRPWNRSLFYPHQKLRALRPRQARERPRPRPRSLHRPHRPRRLLLRRVHREFVLFYECISLNTEFSTE